MKNILKYTTVITLLFLLSSCAGDFRGLYSYYSKSKKENPNLFYNLVKSDSVCKLTKENANSKVIIINGKDLKKCLKNDSRSMIYIWSPNCHSSLCLSLDIIQSVCNSKNISLYIVAEYYENKKMQEDWKIDKPIFGIDIKYYKTSLTDKYTSRFLIDIDVILKKDDYNRCLYFENGSFVQTYESIYDIK